MSECTKKSPLTDREWKMARDCGLIFETPGTVAQDNAIHAFAEMVRQEERAAISKATGAAQ